MSKQLNLIWLVTALFIIIPLYPKFPLSMVSGISVALRLEDFVILLIVLVWLIYQITSGFPVRKAVLAKPIAIYLSIGFASLASAFLLTKSITLSIGLLHAFRRVEYMSLFFIGFSFLTSRTQLFSLTRVIILVSVVVGLFGLGQQFLGFPVVTTNNTEFAKGLALKLGPGARINSTFAGHYDLAAFSALPLLLLLGLLTTSGKHKIILLALSVPIYWAMLLSASRVAFAAFFLVGFLQLVFLRKYLYLLPLLVLSFVSIFLSPQLSGRYRELILNQFKWSLVTPAYAAVDDEIADALKPPEKPEDRSLNIRLNVEWPRALRAFLTNPFLGTGFSSVGLATDNDYLRMLAETGLLGTLAFVSILYKILRSSISYLLSPPTTFPQLFVVCVTCFLVSIMLNAVFIDVFEASKIATVTWLVLGLSEKAKQLT